MKNLDHKSDAEAVQIVSEAIETMSRFIKSHIDVTHARAKAIVRKGKESEDNVFVQKWPNVSVDRVRLLMAAFSGVSRIARETTYLWIEQCLRKVGLPADIILSWAQIGDGSAFEEAVRESLISIAYLERESPGSVKILHDEFNIEHFWRYSAYALLEQVQMREDRGIPYGVAMFAKDDWNGALSQVGGIMDEMRDDLELRGYHMRIMECESDEDVVRSLKQCHQRYFRPDAPLAERGRRISFLNVFSHGRDGSVRLGSGETRWLTSDGARASIDESADGWFEPNSTAIIFSCQGGERNGVAETMAEWMGTVFTPSGITTGLQHVHVDKHKGNIRLRPRFKGTKRVVYRKKDLAN